MAVPMSLMISDASGRKKQEKALSQTRGDSETRRHVKTLRQNQSSKLSYCVGLTAQSLSLPVACFLTWCVHAHLSR